MVDARKWSRARRLEQLSETILMHVAGLKILGTYNGKCNNGLKNPCEYGASVQSGVFSDLLWAVSGCRIIGYG